MLFREYLLSAWGIAREFRLTIETANPLAIVLFNGQFFPEAVARWQAEKSGIRCITHEVALLPFTAFFTEGEATAYPIDIPKEFFLNESQNAQLEAYLEQRFSGNFQMAGIQFWPEMRRLDAGFWEKVERFRQVVPVFTNVIFDTSQGHANTLFPDMFAWLEDLLKVIRSHPETLFVIRAHPDELRKGKESRESVADWARLNQVTELHNVLFVAPEEYLSSYELIQRSKFVMVYNSTIGLEASLLGTPVLCAGKARFTQIPTVNFPQNREEYQAMLETFLTQDKVRLNPEHKINARRFLYFQLFRTALPFSHYLEEDPHWPGYVQLREFDLEDLLPERSNTMGAIVNGIINQTPFLLEL
jgi:hypothetical protein